VKLDDRVALGRGLSILRRPGGSGTVMPARCARYRIASGNAIFWCSSTKLTTSPPTPHPKQWNTPLSRLTVNDGVFS
jgi:hypothetical protein